MPRSISVHENGKLVGCFDPAKAKLLGTVNVTPEAMIQETGEVFREEVYRLPNGEFVLLPSSWDEFQGDSVGPAEKITKQRAAELLLGDGIALPHDMVADLGLTDFTQDTPEPPSREEPRRPEADALDLAVMLGHEIVRAFDPENPGDARAVDLTDARKFPLPKRCREGASAESAYVHWEISSTLLHTASGDWVLREHYHCREAGQQSDPVYRILSQKEAANRFLDAGCEVPCHLAHLVNLPSEALPPGPGVPEKAESNAGVTREKANKRAMELAQADPSFVDRTQREWARAIGCSDGLVAQLPFWQATMERTGRGKPKSAAAPKVVSLTRAVEATTGEGTRDEVLNRLIAQQDADYEPSPLEEDLPDSKPRRVRAPRKKL
jgi:hypothetical protein